MDAIANFVTLNACGQSTLGVIFTLEAASIALLGSFVYRYRRCVQNPQDASPMSRTPWETYVFFASTFLLIVRFLATRQSLGSIVDRFSDSSTSGMAGGFTVFILVQVVIAEWWETRTFKKTVLDPYYARRESLPTTVTKEATELSANPEVSLELAGTSGWQRFCRRRAASNKSVLPVPTAENIKARYHMQILVKYMASFIYMSHARIVGCLSQMTKVREDEGGEDGFGAFELGLSILGLVFFVWAVMRMWTLRRFERRERARLVDAVGRVQYEDEA